MSWCASAALALAGISVRGIARSVAAIALADDLLNRWELRTTLSSGFIQRIVAPRELTSCGPDWPSTEWVHSALRDHGVPTLPWGYNRQRRPVQVVTQAQNVTIVTRTGSGVCPDYPAEPVRVFVRIIRLGVTACSTLRRPDDRTTLGSKRHPSGAPDAEECHVRRAFD